MTPEAAAILQTFRHFQARAAALEAKAFSHHARSTSPSPAGRVGAPGGPHPRVTGAPQLLPAADLSVCCVFLLEVSPRLAGGREASGLFPGAA